MGGFSTTAGVLYQLLDGSTTWPTKSWVNKSWPHGLWLLYNCITLLTVMWYHVTVYQTVIIFLQYILGVNDLVNRTHAHISVIVIFFSIHRNAIVHVMSVDIIYMTPLARIILYTYFPTIKHNHNYTIWLCLMVGM